LTRARPRVEDFIGSIGVIVVGLEYLEYASRGVGWITFVGNVITDIIC
jgi:hypothetical protein